MHGSLLEHAITHPLFLPTLPNPANQLHVHWDKYWIQIRDFAIIVHLDLTTMELETVKNVPWEHRLLPELSLGILFLVFNLLLLRLAMEQIVGSPHGDKDTILLILDWVMEPELNLG